jgi:hypothetical protein
MPCWASGILKGLRGSQRLRVTRSISACTIPSTTRGKFSSSHDFSMGRSVSRTTQPIADDASALLAILRPGVREAIVRHLVALDTKRALDDLGGAVGVVGADCAFEKVGHARAEVRFLA